MLPKDLLEKIPTLNELLEHPRVREATKSWNESTLVARARGALLELGSEISRRTESWSEASPSDLFDRVVHLLDRPDTPPCQEVINATGQIGLETGWKVPLAAEAIAYAARHAGLFTRKELTASNSPNLLKRLTKGESALVASSYVTAHEALLGSLRKQAGERGTIFLGRPDIGSIEPGQRLLSLCDANAMQVIEVGTAQQATLKEYQEAVERFIEQDPDALPMVYFGPAMVALLMQQQEEVALAEFISKMHKALPKQKILIGMALADAAPCELQGGVTCSVLNAAKALRMGADFVLLRGNGIIGGPAVGLIAGKQSALEPIEQWLAYHHWQASDWDHALLEATLTLFEQPERLPFRHPVASLLDTPIDNLRTRADRLAQLMGTSKRVSSAEPIELSDRRVGSGLQAMNSWGIRLTPSAEGGVNAFAEVLFEASPSVRGEIRGEDLILDLRTVFPSQDQQMVCAVLGEDNHASDSDSSP